MEVAVGGGYIVEMTPAVFGLSTRHELSSFWTRRAKGYLSKRS